MITLQQAKHEYRLTHDGDAWGNCMMWLFGVCDEITFERDGNKISVPDEWQYSPSPFGKAGGGEDAYENEILREMSDEDLLAFGQILHRLAGILKAQGRDY